MKTYYVTEFNETWTLTSEGVYENGQEYLNFDVKGGREGIDTVENYNKLMFEAGLKSGDIKLTK